MVGWLVDWCLVVNVAGLHRSSWWPGGATAPILLNPTNNHQRKQNAESHWKAFLFPKGIQQLESGKKANADNDMSPESLGLN